MFGLRRLRARSLRPRRTRNYGGPHRRGREGPGRFPSGSDARLGRWNDRRVAGIEKGDNSGRSQKSPRSPGMAPDPQHPPLGLRRYHRRRFSYRIVRGGVPRSDGGGRGGEGGAGRLRNGGGVSARLVRRGVGGHDDGEESYLRAGWARPRIRRTRGEVRLKRQAGVPLKQLFWRIAPAGRGRASPRTEGLHLVAVAFYSRERPSCPSPPPENFSPFISPPTPRPPPIQHTRHFGIKQGGRFSNGVKPQVEGCIGA